MSACAWCREQVDPSEARVVQGSTFCTTEHYRLWVHAERVAP